MATLKITEDKIIEEFQNLLSSCDADTLADLVGYAFGGICYPGDSEDIYEFIPNENYGGAFGKVEN